VKTWSRGRNGQPGSALDPANLSRFEQFSSSIAVDVRFARYDVRASQTHARALAAAGIIDADEAEGLVNGLDGVLSDIESGAVELRDDLEDIHTHVESRLRETVGSLADTLHTGRSRNDQIATDLRLYTKDATFSAILGLLSLMESIAKLAMDTQSAIMPGYTHLQRGQPVLIAHYLMAHVEMLKRDRDRFADSMKRTDLCPLGSGALAGAGFPLDRMKMATDLGFSSPTANSLDTVSDRDFLIEFISISAQLMVHLSRLAEDFILWSASEFDFLRLPNEFTSGSSMMPQKRNPDTLELVRGKTGQVIGDTVTALTTVKGLPLSYDRDLQELAKPLTRTGDSIVDCLGILAPLVAGLSFNIDKTENAAGDQALATDLADELVRRGVSFRESHRRVSSLVERVVAEGRAFDDLSASELEAVLAPENDGESHDQTVVVDAFELSAAQSIEARRTSGSTNPEMVASAIDEALEEMKRLWERWSSEADAFHAKLG
jgi:argininosuccinate lyase